MREPIDSEYFNWLCAKVLDRTARSYRVLLRTLFTTEFVWIVDADRHRAEDGLELRYDFLREVNVDRDYFWENEPCSVLEVMISLAKRASFQTDIPVRDWFWMFMTNLGLDQFRQVDSYELSVIENILHNLIWRTYDRKGHGGMFPMRWTKNDQRKVELYFQYGEWLEDQGLL